jgi:hypothetical protein
VIRDSKRGKGGSSTWKAIEWRQDCLETRDNGGESKAKKIRN